MTRELDTRQRHQPVRTSSQPHVLLIDDEPGIRAYLRRALQLRGYLVDEVSEGSAGIDLVAETSPHLVLLDLGLPDMPGEDVLRTIRAIQPGLPVLVWSAAPHPNTEQRCRSLGAAFLSKPARLDALLASIEEALLLPPRDPTSRCQLIT